MFNIFMWHFTSLFRWNEALSIKRYTFSSWTAPLMESSISMNDSIVIAYSVWRCAKTPWHLHIATQTDWYGYFGVLSSTCKFLYGLDQASLLKSRDLKTHSSRKTRWPFSSRITWSLLSKSTTEFLNSSCLSSFLAGIFETSIFFLVSPAYFMTLVITPLDILRLGNYRWKNRQRSTMLLVAHRIWFF